MEPLKYDRTISNEDEHYDRSLSHEAARAVREVKGGVQFAEVSPKLENNDSIAYINLRTKEGQEMCVELTCSSYCIVANQFDSIDDKLKEKHLREHNSRYETIDALLTEVSPLYVKWFNESVAQKLNKINDASSKTS